MGGWTRVQCSSSWPQYKARRLCGPLFSSLEMFLPVLVAIFALPALTSGSQFPIADGVIGGVPSPDTCNLKIQKGAFFSNYAPTPTPGKLRVVENSGICGGVFFFTTLPRSF